MKKTFFVLFVTLLSTFALFGCSDSFGKYGKSISEYRDNIFVGSSENFSVQAVTGYRENPFSIDGISAQDKTDFLLVTVTPTVYDPSVEYTYMVTVNGVEYGGKLNKHPLENTYSFEVAAYVSEPSVTVVINGESVLLTSVLTDEYILPSKAFEIALDRLKNTKIVKEGEFEIYVRFIENPINASGGYFWYVAFVDENQQTVAALIEPVTMEIVAVRE